MNNYVTGNIIKAYREKNKLTQEKLASELCISSKTISKWETGKGFPDVSMLESLAKALGVSLTELFEGEPIVNKNLHSDIQKSGFYVCPVCGNIIVSVGDVCVSCHGITLPKLEAENGVLTFECVEDEVLTTIDSPMTKDDYVSFVCGVYCDGIDLIKLYPESDATVRLKKRGLKAVYYYSVRDGLFVDYYKKNR